MSIKVDLDLEFLNDVPNEGLKKLADILVYDIKDGEKRKTQKLANKLVFVNHYPDKLNYCVSEIIHELQLYGGDSIVNLFRRHGVSYREILTDVCDKQNIRYKKTDTVAAIELELLRSVAFDSIDKYKEEAIDEVLEDFGIKVNSDMRMDEKKDCVKELINNPSTRLKAYHTFISQGSCSADSYTQQLGWDALAGVAFAGGFSPIVKAGASQLLKKAGGYILPGVQIVLGLWTISDLTRMVTGPAFRVTAPSVLLIGVLREEYNQRKLKA